MNLLTKTRPATSSLWWETHTVSESDTSYAKHLQHAFSIFAFLWATATLFHLAAYPERLIGIGKLLLALAAIGVLLKPVSIGRFGIFTVVQIITVINDLPSAVSNHWLFTFFVNLTILTVLLRSVWLKKVSIPELFPAFAPAVRIQLIVLYFFAVFQKLNTDFFNPSVSCAATLYSDLATAYPVLPTAPWMLAITPGLTIFVEGLIPILLIFRRTRIAGVLVGMLFHFMLALNPEHTYYDFSSMLYAVYFLFIPYDFLAQMREQWASSSVGRWVAARADDGTLRTMFQGALLVLGSVLFSNWIYQFFRPDSFFESVSGLVAYLKSINIGVWVLYAGALIVIYVRALRWDRLRIAFSGIDTFRLRVAGLAVFPLLLLMNGFAPYFGLKTEISFSMFSNLQTEGLRSNHLFMPTEYRIASYQDDLVRIVDSSAPRLKRFAAEGYMLPYYEFVALTSQRPDISVTYERNGVTRTVARVGDDPELSRRPNVLLRKILKFRPVDTNPGGARCMH